MERPFSGMLLCMRGASPLHLRSVSYPLTASARPAQVGCFVFDVRSQRFKTDPRIPSIRHTAQSKSLHIDEAPRGFTFARSIPFPALPGRGTARSTAARVASQKRKNHSRNAWDMRAPYPYGA